MTTEKMTVHQALADIKVAESRINDILENSIFVATKRHADDKVKGKPVDTFVGGANAQLQKVQDIINRTMALKAAVNESNAKTKITVAGKEYTVAEVICYITRGNYQSALYQTLYSQYIDAQKKADSSNDKLQDKATEVANSVTNESGKTTIKSDEWNAIRDGYIAGQTVEVVGVNDIEKKIGNMQEALDKFNTEADGALQTSNATTMIEITY